MKANGILVDHVSEVTDELVEVMAQLLAQLSSTAAALGRADLEEIVASPCSMLLVARLASRDDAIVGMTTLITYWIPSGPHAVIEDVVVDDVCPGPRCRRSIGLRSRPARPRVGCPSRQPDVAVVEGGREPFVHEGWFRETRDERLPAELEMIDFVA